MKECIEVQEQAFKAIDSGSAIHRPRIDMYAPTERPDAYYRWGTMEGWYEGILAIRMKSDIVTWPRTANGGWTEGKYCMEPGRYCGLIMLFSSKNGEPLALINDGVLQHRRVGGGAGIGVKYLARKDASTIGMLGSGGMARTVLEATSQVRAIRRCKVYSPTKANRESFAREMEGILGIEVLPVSSAREAVRNVDILATATDSMTPVFESEWLEPGMHVAVLGPFELSGAAENRCDVKVRQGTGGSRIVETERVQAGVGMSPIAWIAGTEDEVKRLPGKTPGGGFGDSYPNFCDLALGRTPGRTSDSQITLYYNMGNQGLQFAAVGGLVWRKACAIGLGRPLPTDWFIQAVRN
jgi:ornithine cyclodeaminase/alanine dehydrogenase-like protein (mu-crystallin family)